MIIFTQWEFCNIGWFNHLTMIKLSRPWAETAPSGPPHGLQIRRGPRRTRPTPAGRNQADFSQQPRRKPPGPTLLIQRQEMAAFFRLFGGFSKTSSVKPYKLNVTSCVPLAAHLYIRFITSSNQKCQDLYSFRIRTLWFAVCSDDDLIQDFLWMDCCCKLTDKVARHILVYLIASGFQIVLSFVVEFRKIYIVSCVSKPSSLCLYLL